MIDCTKRLGNSVAVEVQTLLRTAYTLEAAQIQCTDFPPLRETMGDLQCCPDEFLLFRDGAEIVGVLSFQAVGGVATITRLAVDPAHVRRGIATALLEDLERRLPVGMRVNVSTAMANTPAVSLYEKAGYVRQRATRSAEGIALVHFTKHRVG